MSVFIIRNDDLCKLFNRTVFVCYTRMKKRMLIKYIRDLELCTSDRISNFFKIDVDILAAPTSLRRSSTHRPLFRIEDWVIVTITLKSEATKKFPFPYLIRLFYRVFPHPVKVDYCTEDMIICSADIESGQAQALSAEDMHCFHTLSKYHETILRDIKTMAEDYNSERRQPKDCTELIVFNARKYHLYGGNWLMFLTIPNERWQEVFDLLLRTALDSANWGIINHFNAKISSIAEEKLIFAYGNEYSTASVNASIIDYIHTDGLLMPSAYDSKLDNRKFKQDRGASEVEAIISGIYKPELFGLLQAKYKTDVMSACCIQRGNVLRPTVYQMTYGTYSKSFRPCEMM